MCADLPVRPAVCQLEVCPEAERHRRFAGLGGSQPAQDDREDNVALTALGRTIAATLARAAAAPTAVAAAASAAALAAAFVPGEPPRLRRRLQRELPPG